MYKKKKGFRIFCAIICALMLLGATCVSANAETKAYNWYCVHAKGHIQPKVNSELAFVEELGGYYIDHRHTEESDAQKVIYLTFDVGYENGNVAKVLDVLKEENVSGTFFVLGHVIEKESELVKRMVAEGHTVGNHTVRHKDMSAASGDILLAELKELEDKYYNLTGEPMQKLYRPPEGSFSKENLETLYENGYQTVFWSFAYPDWDNHRQMSPEKAKQIILDNAHNGEVMLLHPTSRVNAEILSSVIVELKAQGYRFGRIQELVQNDLARAE